jgi:hypothetical protein
MLYNATDSAPPHAIAGGGATMLGETNERWMELCQRASTEQDPDKLLELIREINDLLEEKHARLANEEIGDKSPH